MALECRLLAAIVLVVSASALPFDGKLGRHSDTIAEIQSYGYPAEAHHVTTSDGYVLELHRVPHGKGQSPSGDRPVVFLMHGLLGASDSYTNLGPGLSKAYILADAGFDVWMGNARGNKESRKHVSLNPDDDQEKFRFFDFSFEEIALIDLPAMLDYALETAGQEKLHYIGHSQGGTVFLVLCSMKPEYNAKFESVHLMAGVGYMRNFPTGALAAAAVFTDLIHATARSNGVVELFPPNSEEGAMDTITSYCAGNSAVAFICDLIEIETIVDPDHVNDLEPAGAAFKQLVHYGQNLRDREFRRYSYGWIENLSVYGAMTPPRYNLGLITAPVTMHYTVSDILLGEGDVLAMAADMPNATVRKVERESFLHVDFVVANDLKELVTDYIVDALKAPKNM